MNACRHLALVATLVAPFVPVVPAGAQELPPQSGTVVCYALRLVPGEVDPARWGWVHHPPDLVALDSVPVKRAVGPAGFRLRPPIGRAPLAGREPAWRMDGDTLEMRWNDGLTGVKLRGRVAAPTFSGLATIITDVVTGSPHPTARFEAELVACPAQYRTSEKQAPSA